MLEQLSLRGKFLALESLAVVMFLAMAVFGVVELNGAIDDAKENVVRLNLDIEVMGEIGSMNIAFLKEVKLVKDVWIRGSDADKVKNYREEFTAQKIAENVNQETDAVSSMASAIEELSVSTTHISDQGGTAKQIAHDSRINAEQGARVVNSTVSGLLSSAQEIESASAEVSRLGQDASRISDIVQVIKEIADQTNLRALNAAIEAARAGEQGRGFAVVADEVRKLAERTSGATNEINQISAKIGSVAAHALGSMGKVVESTRQEVSSAETAQSSIALIQKSFSDMAEVIDDISASVTEQTAAANDLAQNTERISSMSEQNANAAQNLLSLSNDLEAKAREVRQSVEVFRV